MKSHGLCLLFPYSMVSYCKQDYNMPFSGRGLQNPDWRCSWIYKLGRIQESYQIHKFQHKVSQDWGAFSAVVASQTNQIHKCCIKATVLAPGAPAFSFLYASVFFFCSHGCSFIKFSSRIPSYKPQMQGKPLPDHPASKTRCTQDISVVSKTVDVILVDATNWIQYLNTREELLKTSMCINIPHPSIYFFVATFFFSCFLFVSLYFICCPVYQNPLVLFI